MPLIEEKWSEHVRKYKKADQKDVTSTINYV